MRIKPAGTNVSPASPGRWQDSFGVGALVLATLLVLCGSFASRGVSRFVRQFYQTGDLRVALSYAAGEYQFTSYFANYSSLKSIIEIPNRLLRPTTAPTIIIDIKYKNVEKLHRKREEALYRGILVQGDDDFVAASIRIGDQTVKAKLRLKGDWVDHMVGEKMSLRVHMKGDAQLFGMRRFSLQHPRTRGYQTEPLFLETLKFFDVLAPRYMFVNVILNGDNLGIMAFEEHFSKELLEHQGRKEGVIVRFDESLVWSHYAATKESGGPYYSYQNAEIGAFQETKIGQSETLSSDYVTAVGLLRAFVERKLLASEVFDTERLGSFLAVADFWGGWHTLDWLNMRFYFNPITMKLEPVGYDAELQNRHHIGQTRPTARFPISVSMLDDPVIFSSYKRALSILSDKLGDGSLISQLDRIERRHLDVLQKEFLLLEPFDMDELKERTRLVFGDIQAIEKTEYGRIQDAISTALTWDNSDVDKVDSDIYGRKVHAYVVDDPPGQPYVELASAIPHGVVIQDLQWMDNIGNAKPAVSWSKIAPLSLSATSLGGVPQSVRIPLNSRPELPGFEIVATGTVQGSSTVFQQRAKPYPGVLDKHPIPSELNTSEDFLVTSENGALFAIKEGTWKVLEPIILPAGARLRIGKGTTLRFAAGAFMLVRGATDFDGAAGAPIVLEGISTADGADSWQGIVTMDAGGKSTWSHVTVRNTAGIEYGPWRLTGGVTFYYSDIDMNNCDFIGNRGEDALNIIHSEFELDRIKITDTASDGFDGDFTTGSIRRSLFRDIGQLSGGDAFDLSGSVVTMDGTEFLRISDKALSVGEDSKLTVNGLTIEDVGTGAASKDRSELEIDDATIRGARVAGLLAYIKKPEYGPARLIATDTDIVESEITARVQIGSLMRINGDVVESRALDVDALYETVMKRGER